MEKTTATPSRFPLIAKFGDNDSTWMRFESYQALGQAWLSADMQSIELQPEDGGIRLFERQFSHAGKLERTNRWALTGEELYEEAGRDALSADHTWTLDLEWADEQFDSMTNPNQADVKAFDESEDGAAYLALVGMTMWANLGGDTLPATAELAEELR